MNMIHSNAQQIQIIPVENGFIVILPIDMRPPKKKHRLRVDHSDPVLENLQQEEEILGPEPFMFKIQAGVHVFPDYQKVLEFLATLKDSKKIYPGGRQAEFAPDEYFD